MHCTWITYLSIISGDNYHHKFTTVRHVSVLIVSQVFSEIFGRLFFFIWSSWDVTWIPKESSKISEILFDRDFGERCWDLLKWNLIFWWKEQKTYCTKFCYYCNIHLISAILHPSVITLHRIIFSILIWK